MSRLGCGIAAFLALTALVLVSAAQSFAALPSILGSSPIVFPLLSPKLSSGYGNRNHPVAHYVRHHNGVDLAAPKHTHVRAVLQGTVVFADNYAGYGKLVTVEHADGFVSLYGHLSEIRVNPGQKVAAGKILGLVGSTGLATGPHLHFEWRRNGKAIDPLEVFPAIAETPEG